MGRVSAACSSLLSVDVEHSLVSELLPLHAVLGNVLEKIFEGCRAIAGTNHVLRGVVAPDASKLGLGIESSDACMG